MQSVLYEVSWHVVEQWQVGKHIGALLLGMNGSSHRTNLVC